MRASCCARKVARSVGSPAPTMRASICAPTSLRRDSSRSRKSRSSRPRPDAGSHSRARRSRPSTLYGRSGGGARLPPFPPPSAITRPSHGHHRPPVERRQARGCPGAGRPRRRAHDAALHPQVATDRAGRGRESAAVIQRAPRLATVIVAIANGCGFLYNLRAAYRRERVGSHTITRSRGVRRRL